MERENHNQSSCQAQMETGFLGLFEAEREKSNCNFLDQSGCPDFFANQEAAIGSKQTKQL